MKGAYGEPANTGVGYSAILSELGDHSVPASWAQYVKNNTTPNTVPGAPISWTDPENPAEPNAGYGFIADISNGEEETFFYHSDHLGSTSYITDKDGNITQYTAYLPYGELLIDEHSSSEDMPYKFNGKELDEETGLYYYGARYLNPQTSLWYGVDPLMEKYPNVCAYAYCKNNPIVRIDPDGRDDYFSDIGRFLYSQGDGTAIHVKQNDEFVLFQTIDLNSRSNMQLAANIVGHYAKAIGIKYNMNGGSGTVGVHKEAIYESGKIKLADTEKGNINIRIENGKMHDYMYEIYSLRGTLRHEYEHKKDQDSGAPPANELRHAEIVLTEMEHSDFKKTSSLYQNAQKGQFDNYVQQARSKILNNEKLTLEQQISTLNTLSQLKRRASALINQ